MASRTDQPTAPPAPTLKRIDDWIAAHLNLIALLVIAAGFVLRTLYAQQTFLVPDESIYYRVVNQRDFHSAYLQSLNLPHPPLLFVILYWIHFLGRSELALRLPSVLAGSASLWFLFRWFRKALNDRVALIGLILLAFSPALMVLSAEARQYALMLFFLAVTLDSLERAFTEKSTGWMALSGAALCLAIASHYSAIWFALTLGIYALWRISRRELPGKLVRVWAGTQAAALAVCGLLYVTHISSLRHADWVRSEIKEFLAVQYFQAGQDRVVPFVVVHTADFFMYLFAQDEVGAAMFAFFLLGIILLAWNKAGVADRRRSRELAMLLVLPFVIGVCGAIAGLYPYGGVRYGAYLAPFAVAGASLSLAWLARGRAWLSVMMPAAIVAACFLAGSGPPEYIRPENQRKALMVDAAKYIRQSVSTGQPLLVDDETSAMLKYYLCPDEIPPTDDQQGSLIVFSCGRYRIVGLRLWNLTASNFPAQFAAATQTAGIHADEIVTVIHAGWNESSEDKSLFTHLAARQPELQRWPHRDFGDNISIFQLAAGAAAGSP